jgi:hypothetical protein
MDGSEVIATYNARLWIRLQERFFCYMFYFYV